jgi:hypothetical protein
MAGRTYRVTFLNHGNVYEIYARSVGAAAMLGFVEIGQLVWSQKSAVVIDPGEDRLKHEFDGVKRFFVPMHAIVRIDEVDREGTARVTAGHDAGSEAAGGTKVAPFPVFAPPPGDKKH